MLERGHAKAKASPSFELRFKPREQWPRFFAKHLERESEVSCFSLGGAVVGSFALPNGVHLIH